MSKGKFEVIRNLQKESVQFLLVPRSLQQGGVLLQWQRWCDTFAPFNEASSLPSNTINDCTFLEYLPPQLWMPRQPTPRHPTGSTYVQWDIFGCISLYIVSICCCRCCFLSQLVASIPKEIYRDPKKWYLGQLFSVPKHIAVPLCCDDDGTDQHKEPR